LNKSDNDSWFDKKSAGTPGGKDRSNLNSCRSPIKTKRRGSVDDSVLIPIETQDNHLEVKYNIHEENIDDI